MATPLTMLERRILGVLVEKAKTTPDVYPLSINSVVTGSNQKSNREPVLTLSDDDVTDNLLALQQKGLVTRITGGRVERWRHNLYEQWQVDKVELAILTELLLRGPQTEGELRGRASRMEPIDDLEALRTKLRLLSERGLVVLLGELGRRGTQVTHGFHEADELENIRTRAGADAAASVATEAVAATGASAPAVPRSSERLEALEGSLAQAHQEIAALRLDVEQLKSQLAELIH